jgi:hypothetical protein
MEGFLLFAQENFNGERVTGGKKREDKRRE